MNNLLFFSPLITTLDNVNDIEPVTNSVTNIAKAISDYGPVIVILAIFFVLFLSLSIFVLRNNNKMMTQIMTNQANSDKLNQELINKFVDDALSAQSSRDKTEMESITKELKNSIMSIENTIKTIQDEDNNQEDDNYHKNLVGAYIDVNMAFKDASRTALENLKCNRVAIYVFHNGNKSLHGLPFFKMSCIHEWTNRGNNTLRGKSHIDMPLHLFNGFIENLWSQGYYKVENVDTSENINSSIEEFIAFSNVKALYMVGIKDKNSSLSGFVVTEFDVADTFESDENRDIAVRQIINDMIVKISPIVSNKYIYNGSNSNND